MAGKSARYGEGRGNFLRSGDASGKDKDFRTHTTAPSDISNSFTGGDFTRTPGDGYKYHTFINRITGFLGMPQIEFVIY